MASIYNEEESEGGKEIDINHRENVHVKDLTTSEKKIIDGFEHIFTCGDSCIILTSSETITYAHT